MPTIIAKTRGSICGRLFLSVFLACLMVTGTHADDWVQYNGNIGNRTSNETIGAINWSQASPPTPYWKIPTTNGFSCFSVSGGKAFTLISRVHTDSVLREFCVAYNTSSGTELWASPMSEAAYTTNPGGGSYGGGDGPRSTPTCDGERVYVIDRDLNLYCFNAATGATVWSKDIVTNYGGRNITWQNAASPLLEGELVAMAGGGAGQSFLAFNRTDGALVWQTNVDEKMTHASPVAATIHGVRQIIFFAQSGLVAVDSSTGAELWRYAFPYSSSTGASPVVCGDYIYCSAGWTVGAGVCKVNMIGPDFQAVQVWLKTGEFMNQWSTPVYYNGYLFGLFGRGAWDTAPLKCVELATGNEMWSEPNFGQGGLILVENKLVVLGAAGDIAVVEATPTAYTEIARADMLDGKCWSSPVLSDNRIYARTTTEGVCFELSNIASSLTAPSNPRATTITPDSITCAWDDNSNGETAFMVYFGEGAAAPAGVTSTTAANATQLTATGLLANTQYAFQVCADNATTQSPKTEIYTTWTLSTTPTAPLVGNPTESTLDISIGAGDANPAGTEYAIFCETTGEWVQANGLRGPLAAWQTKASWAATSCSGLSANTTYNFQVKARNGAAVETSLGPLGGARPQRIIKAAVSPTWALY